MSDRVLSDADFNKRLGALLQSINYSLEDLERKLYEGSNQRDWKDEKERLNFQDADNLLTGEVATFRIYISEAREALMRSVWRDGE